MADQETITSVPERGEYKISGQSGPELWLPVPVEEHRQPVPVWESVCIGIAWAFLLTFSLIFWSGLIFFLF